MKPVIRHSLFIFFLVVFLVTAPVLIFLASGYRYNLAKNKVEQTGQLLVTSKPNGAEVRIDGQAQVSVWKKLLQLAPSRTPIRIKNLLSGQYRVDISEQESWPWSRTVGVTAQQTTFVTEIVLFPKSKPKSLISAPGVRSFIQSGSNTLIYSKDSDLLSSPIDSSAGASHVIWHAPEAITGFKKSPLSDSFIVETKGGIWLVTNAARVEATQFPSDFQKVRWSPRGAMVAHSDKAVILLDAKGKVVSTIVSGQIADVMPVDEDVFYLTKTPEGVALARVTSAKTAPKGIAVFPLQLAHFVDQDNENYLAVTGNEKMYVMELSSGSYYTTLIEGTHQLVWLQPDEALASGDFEIWRYTFQGSQHAQDLITRQSTPITSLVGYDGFPYVMFERGNSELIGMELYPESPNTYTLAEGDFSHMAVSKNGKELLMSGSLKGGEQGIFSLPFKY